MESLIDMLEARHLDSGSFETDAAFFRVEKRSEAAFAERISIGRTKQCDLSLQDYRISKLHAYLEPRPHNRYVVVDCGSRNGTKVDGRLLETGITADLASGSTLELGPFAFKFLSSRQMHAHLCAMIVLLAKRERRRPETFSRSNVGRC
jgi:predicted component of type VI protein secretion system